MRDVLISVYWVFEWQAYGFSSGHIWMWELDCEESWALKNLCFWTVVLEKALESPLDCKEIQPVHPKGNQSWISIGKTDTEAETPILWPPDVKNWFIWKDPDPGKDWRQEKGMTEDETVGWHHQLNGHEFELTPRVANGQGGLACCRPWGHKESDTTERLNWTELIGSLFLPILCSLKPSLHPIILYRPEMMFMMIIMMDKREGKWFAIHFVFMMCYNLC